MAFFGEDRSQRADKKANKDLYVLIAEDEQFMMSMLKRMLAKIDVENVYEATDGQDALNKLESCRVDLIVSDIMMKPMNGLELLKSVRSGKSSAAANTPFFVFTGSEESSVFGTALALDCDAFVSKGSDPQELAEKIEKRCVGDRDLEQQAFYSRISIPTILHTVTENPEPIAQEAPANSKSVSFQNANAGDVLAADLHAPDGSVLYAAETEMTETRLQKLSDIGAFITLPPLIVKTD